MDGLDDNERVLAWLSGWHPSFDGKAIVNEDFTFRAANPQFCKLLGVTPGDLYERRFQDITPPGIREKDERNAKMIKDGLIDFYWLRKSYQFADGREVKVVLLVTRVPETKMGPFQFFLARIMLDEDDNLAVFQDKESESVPSSPTWIKSVADFWIKYGKHIISIGTFIGAIIGAAYIAIMGK